MNDKQVMKKCIPPNGWLSLLYDKAVIYFAHPLGGLPDWFFRAMHETCFALAAASQERRDPDLLLLLARYYSFCLSLISSNFFLYSMGSHVNPQFFK